MEQLVAREAHNLEVVGSSPTPATEKPSRNRRFFYFLRNFSFTVVGVSDSKRGNGGQSFEIWVICDVYRHQNKRRPLANALDIRRGLRGKRNQFRVGLSFTRLMGLSKISLFCRPLFRFFETLIPVPQILTRKSSAWNTPRCVRVSLLIIINRNAKPTGPPDVSSSRSLNERRLSFASFRVSPIDRRVRRPPPQFSQSRPPSSRPTVVLMSPQNFTALAVSSSAF